MWLIKLWKSAAFDFFFYLLEQELNHSSLLPNTAHLQELCLQRHQCSWALNPFPAEGVPQEKGTMGSSIPARHHQITVVGWLLPVSPNNKQGGHHRFVNSAAEWPHLK